MPIQARRSAAALAFLCALAGPARAESTLVTLGPGWTKLAPAGQAVEVQALTGLTLTTAAATPDASAPAASLAPGERWCRTLGTDLWARSGSATVTSGVACAADPQNAAIGGVVPMTVGATYPAQRSIGESCTAAGTATLTFADGSSMTVPLGVGYQQQGFAVTQVASTTATCSFYNLK